MDKAIIYSVIQTLNQIEVKGEQNLNGLLACIQTLNRLVTDEGKEVSDHA